MKRPAAPPAAKVRLQVFVDAAEVKRLDRQAKTAGVSRSQAAAAAIRRGLGARADLDPEDRLRLLERRLGDHMRLTSRDLRIVEELVFNLTRMLLTRLPETAADRDPFRQAAVEQRLQQMLNDVASKIAAGPVRKAQASADELA